MLFNCSRRQPDSGVKKEQRKVLHTSHVQLRHCLTTGRDQQLRVWSWQYFITTSHSVLSRSCVTSRAVSHDACKPPIQSQ